MTYAMRNHLFHSGRGCRGLATLSSFELGNGWGSCHGPEAQVASCCGSDAPLVSKRALHAEASGLHVVPRPHHAGTAQLGPSALLVPVEAARQMMERGSA